MIDQKVENDNAVREFMGEMPLRSLACTYQGNTTVRNHQRRWEFAILQMMNGMELYAKLYRNTYDGTIGFDALFEPIFIDFIHGLTFLLNGEKGRLDGGEMMKYLRAIALKHNIEFPE